MGSIRVLPELLRNQIAAGEVVERPASILKELIENSLDARANQLEILLEEGGIRRILLRDNGKGMDEEDLKMALKRHATSKIQTSEDLFQLTSFGFRGEALAAIAAVSRIAVTSKPSAAPFALRITAIENEPEKVGAPDGTEVLIEDLFASVPARRKFLKSESAENTHSLNMIEQLALANPEISFRVRCGEKEVLDLPCHEGPEKMLARIRALFGKEFAANLVPLQFLGEPLAISGFVSHPHVHRRNRKSQHVFVNKRPISDRIVSAAISEAFASLIPKGFYPDVVLFLEVAPDLVDVNVHPRKSEVKFRNERDIFLAVKGAIESALKPDRNITLVNSPWTLHAPQNDRFQSPPSFSGFGKSPSEKYPPTVMRMALPEFESFAGNSLDRSPEYLPVPEYQPTPSRLIGQIQNSFILVEEEDGLLIVDQHAAHERVRYEKLMNDLRAKTPRSQNLLIPQILEITAAEREIIFSYQEVFTDLGFEIQEFSNAEIALFAVPAGTENVDFRENLKNLLHDLDGMTPEEGRTVSLAAERIATFAACKGAIKFGDPLTREEMAKLLDDLEQCDGKYACAHGRPVAMKVLYEEMRRRCGR